MVGIRDNKQTEVHLTRRRLLVVIVMGGLGGYVLGGLISQPIVSGAAMVVMVGAWLVLRRAIETMADRPDDELDERQIGVRDRAYLSAYRLIGGAIAVLVLVTIGWDAFDVTDVSTRIVQTGLGGLLFALIGLPTCIVGWSEPEV